MGVEESKEKGVAEATAETERTMRLQKVPVNVYETTGALVVIAPLPAVKAEDVTIDLTPGTLRFSAHLRSAGPRDYLLHEWEYGGDERAGGRAPGVDAGGAGRAARRPRSPPL